jgi:KipI family sensor histidine kinase inhibitor
MGESALLVKLGKGVSPAVNDHVHALARNLRHLDVQGVQDIVPAYASLLVTFDDAVLTEQVLNEHIRRATDEGVPGASPEARQHVIPVLYGGDAGPDLEELAASHGLTPDELVRRHTQALYRVYFLGFMPGFGYLGGLDPLLASPRLPSPRVRVPAGSVGIAGDQTGIYPFASPGGWQLIGRTGVPLWDVSRDPPALLAPADEVRFVATDSLDFSQPAPGNQLDPYEPGSFPVFAVDEPGALTTLQDRGRPGYGHLGLSAGGVMDLGALKAANELVRNPATAAALEVTWSGPAMRALATTVIAVTGGDIECRVDGTRVPHGIGWLVRAGSVLRFTGAKTGARCYLAVAGGFSAEPVLGSRSTYLPGSFGGYHGRQLQAGDVLYSNRHTQSPAELAGRTSEVTAPLVTEVTVLRYVPYLGQESVSADVRERASSSVYAVSPASDRMGVRLLPEKEDVLAGGGGELTSFGVVRGAIQLPPGGTPVVLGADHQTTGGYPLLGVVVRADWSRLAQLRPGDKVRLVPVSLEEARAVLSVKQRAP